MNPRSGPPSRRRTPRPCARGLGIDEIGAGRRVVHRGSGPGSARKIMNAPDPRRTAAGRRTARRGGGPRSSAAVAGAIREPAEDRLADQSRGRPRGHDDPEGRHVDAVLGEVERQDGQDGAEPARSQLRDEERQDRAPPLEPAGESRRGPAAPRLAVVTDYDRLRCRVCVILFVAAIFGLTCCPPAPVRLGLDDPAARATSRRCSGWACLFALTRGRIGFLLPVLVLAYIAPFITARPGFRAIRDRLGARNQDVTPTDDYSRSQPRDPGADRPAGSVPAVHRRRAAPGESDWIAGMLAVTVFHRFWPTALAAEIPA